MKWFLSLFPQYRAMEATVAEYAERVSKAAVQAAWAQRKLDEATASERAAWAKAVEASQMGGDLAAQYAFGRSMFGVGPEVQRRTNEVKQVPGPRNVRDVMRRAQHEILEDIDKAEAALNSETA